MPDDSYGTANSNNGAQVYLTGLVATSVCVPAEWPQEYVERWVNEEWPTGIDSRWAVTEEAFATGEPNPCPCDQNPQSRHWVLSC